MALAQIHFQDLQRLPNLANHVSSKWRRHHLCASANKQRILKEIAKAFEGMADGGLREIELLASASNIPLAVDRLEHDEEIKVDLS